MENPLTPIENSKMNINVRLPKLTLNILEGKINDFVDAKRVLEIGIEEVAFSMYSESKPVYSLQCIKIKNLYILDPKPPVPTMPYLLQLVLDQDLIHYQSSTIHSDSIIGKQLPKEDYGVEIELETNPRGREGFNRTKLHTKG